MAQLHQPRIPYCSTEHTSFLAFLAQDPREFLGSALPHAGKPVERMHTFHSLTVFLLPLLFVCLQGKERLWADCKILEIRNSLTLPHVQWKDPRTHVVVT